MQITEKVRETIEGLKFDEDATQDFYVAWLQLPEQDFEDDRHRSSFIYNFVRNIVNNRNRVERNRERILSEFAGEVASVLFGTSESPDDPARILEGQQELGRKLKDLTPLLQRTLELHLDGNSPEEVAQIEGCSRNTIDQRMHQIKETLKGE